jgi:hypothetical protein
MDRLEGMRQRKLRGIVCRWGNQMRRETLLIPVFQADYKVRGFIGISSRVRPVWYGGVPITVASRELAFKAFGSKAATPLPECDPEVFQGAFYFDTAYAVRSLANSALGHPAMLEAVNLAGQRLRGHRVHDVVFERSWHRVRGFILRRGLLSFESISVMRIPGLANALQPRMERRPPQPLSPRDRPAGRSTAAGEQLLREVTRTEF